MSRGWSTRVGVLAVAAASAVALVVAPADTKTRLRVTAIPEDVLAGQSVKVQITGTRSRRCALSVRADKFRATPYLRRRVGRRSTLTLPARSSPGGRVLTVRCGERRAYARLTVHGPDADLGSGGMDLPPEDDAPPPDDMAPPPDDESPPPVDDEAPPEQEPIEVPAETPEQTPPGVPPDAQAPSAPTSLSVTARSTSTVSVSWKASSDNVGVKGYSAYRGSTRVANVTSAGYRFTGLGCGTSYALAVTAYDAAGNTSAKASITAGTSACPPPPKKVTLEKGASAQGRPGCSSSACRFMEVSFSGFSSGSHTVTCRASQGQEGGFYSYVRSGGSNTSAVCYYGFPGRAAWVTVDGVSSNKITW